MTTFFGQLSIVNSVESYLADANKNTYFFQAAEMAAKQGGGMENPSAETADPATSAAAPSAVIAPSSVTHAGAAVVRHKELAPSTVDTGKDTQCLVEEDDSEC